MHMHAGMVTTHYALRASLDLMLVGAHAPYRWSRQVSAHGRHGTVHARTPLGVQARALRLHHVPVACAPVSAKSASDRSLMMAG